MVFHSDEFELNILFLRLLLLEDVSSRLLEQVADGHGIFLLLSLSEFHRALVRKGRTLVFRVRRGWHTADGEGLEGTCSRSQKGTRLKKRVGVD